MKKISKILSMLLAILMVVCALPVYASAQDVTLIIESSKEDIKAGDTVTVDVVLSENSNLNYFTFDLVYDNSNLEYVSNKICKIDGQEVTTNSFFSDNKIRVAVANLNPITAGGTVLSVDLKTLSSSCSTISLDVIESGDNNFNNIAITFSSIKIHSFGDWKTVKEPTCEATGEKSKSCTCGAKVTESISALGHDYATEYTVDSEADCTVNGSKSQHCSRCDSKQNTTVIPATGHDYKDEITKVPTHTENGEKTFTCKNCNHTYTETIEADGTHKYISDVTKEPTCTEKGVLTFACACGDKYTEDIPAKGHTVVTLNAVAPTCTQTGLTAGTKCSVCNVTLTAQEEIPSTSHIVNSDGYCDNCEEKVCNHNCHKGGISGFFWKIANFFNKLFGSKKYCECGYAHY